MNGRLGRIAAVSFSVAATCAIITVLASAGDWIDGDELPWAGKPWVGRTWAAASRSCGGPRSSRSDARERRTADLAWSGGDAIKIRIPAQVHYQPGPSPRASVTGDADLVGHVRLRDGSLEWETPEWGRQVDCLQVDDLVVQLSGPAVTAWTVQGSASLELSDLHQDALRITAQGSGAVTASGEVRDTTVEAAGSGGVDLGRLAARTTMANVHGSGNLKLPESSQDSLRITLRGSGGVSAGGTAQQVSLDASGSGRADLGRLVTERANATIRGSGDVDLAPRQDADISVSGSGVVRLHGAVARLSSYVSGSGRVKQVP
ncbi:GIN domain-containing protein [Bradyrhizobium sp. HKCCYLS3077]|uniref:GIN domain-containing protein n=1 Tax=Bradyrhizobium sp. HKCCYLS3077 TaxID=3420761 RepID=UPI003EBA5948